MMPWKQADRRIPNPQSEPGSTVPKCSALASALWYVRAYRETVHDLAVQNSPNAGQVGGQLVRARRRDPTIADDAVAAKSE
jgi:hypothetical protein